MALPGSGLVAPSPPRPGQDEIRQLIFRPYQSGEQPAHFRRPLGESALHRDRSSPLCSWFHRLILDY